MLGFFIVFINVVAFFYFASLFVRLKFNLLDLFFFNNWVLVFIYFSIQYFNSSYRFEDEIALTTIVCYLAFIALIYVGKYVFPYCKTQLGDLMVQNGLEQLPFRWVLVINYAFLFTIVFLIMNFGFVFWSVQDEKNIPYWLNSILQTDKIIIYGSVIFIFSRWKELSKAERFLCIPPILCYGLWSFLLGRRVIVGFVFLIFVLMFIKLKGSLTSRRKVQVMLFALSLCIGLPIALDYYQSIRYNLHSVRSSNSMSLQSSASKIFYQSSEGAESTSHSVLFRNSPLSFLYTIVDRIELDEYNEFLYFKSYVNEFLLGIPSVFTGSKKGIEGVDLLVAQAMNLFVTDYPQTILSQSLASFGYFGVPIASLFILCFLSFLLMIANFGGPITKLYALGAIVNALFTTEGQTALFLFVLLRNVLLFIPLDILLKFFTALKEGRNKPGFSKKVFP